MAAFGFLGGHLGSSVSALVDGQLAPDDADRAWEHVGGCVPCRRLVEHEGWVKRQLAQIAGAPAREDAPEELVGSLLHLGPEHTSIGDTGADIDWTWDDEAAGSGSRTRRRAGLVLVGAGSVSAAVFGLNALSGSPLQLGGSGSAPGPATSIGNGTRPSPSTTLVTPVASVHARLRGWTVSGGPDRRTGVAHAIAPQH